MIGSGAAGVSATEMGALLLAAARNPAPGRWLVIGALALVALWLLVSAVRCLFRLVGLAVLLLVVLLVWRWLA